MPISWNEIRHNAIAFSKEWANETSEDAEGKTFWDEFFAAFGIKRRVVAAFEDPVKQLSGTYGYIDLFWKGTLIVEHKSRGKPLDKAHSQAMGYIQSLKSAGRDNEVVLANNDRRKADVANAKVDGDNDQQGRFTDQQPQGVQCLPGH